MSSDRKKIAFQGPAGIVVRQAGEKADKRLLNDILGRRPVARAAFHESQKSTLEVRNEIVPSYGLAGADALYEQVVDLRRGHRRLCFSIAVT